MEHQSFGQRCLACTRGAGKHKRVLSEDDIAIWLPFFILLVHDFPRKGIPAHAGISQGFTAPMENFVQHPLLLLIASQGGKKEIIQAGLLRSYFISGRQHGAFTVIPLPQAQKVRQFFLPVSGRQQDE